MIPSESGGTCTVCGKRPATVAAIGHGKGGVATKPFPCCPHCHDSLAQSYPCFCPQCKAAGKSGGRGLRHKTSEGASYARGASLPRTRRDLSPSEVSEETAPNSQQRRTNAAIESRLRAGEDPLDVARDYALTPAEIDARVKSAINWAHSSRQNLATH